MPIGDESNVLLSPRDVYSSAIMNLTNPDDLLKTLENNYRGKQKIKGEWVQVGEPLMNDYGISSVMGQVRSVVNQMTIMSRTDMNEIRAIVSGLLAESLAKDLMLNKIRYEIHNPESSRTKIYFPALITAYFCAKRSYEGDDKKFWKGTQQEITTTVNQTNQNKGLLNPFKKNPVFN